MGYESPYHMKMRSITNQKIKDKEKRMHHIQNVEDKLMHQTTQHTTPNMMDAYKKVQQTDYEPSEEEINYRQQNTSGYIPH